VKRILVLVPLFIIAVAGSAQRIDSIVFHLYTDSLKKGTYNYINVDAKLSNGAWQPMTAKEIQFTSSACHFSGNELVIPADFDGEKITVKAVLKANPSLSIEKTIWIKKKPDPAILPTREDVLNNKATGNKKRR
jgi:hypothetical protein